MATIKCSYNGGSFTTDLFMSGSYNNGAKMEIKGVTYNTSTGKYTISYKCTLYDKTGDQGRYNNTARYIAFGGEQQLFETNTILWSNWENGTIIKESSYTTSSTSVPVYVKVMFNYTYSDARWNAGTGCVDGASTLSITPAAASFNLNILNPDGSEPYQTGEAGTVEQSINGGSYSRVYNEGANSYPLGTTFNYRNFIPGTGRHLSSVSGISPNNTTGPWSATLNSDLTVTFQTAWNTYTISYAPNGGSSTPSSQTKTYGQALTLRAGISRSNSTGSGYTTSFNGNGGTYTGSSITATDTYSYTFAGWKSSASGTVYGASGTFNENNVATMTAQWTTTTTRGSITLPAASTVSRSGYTFKGWNTSSTATTGLTGTYTPTSSTTMYAIWQLNAPTAATVSLDYVARDKIYVKGIGYTGAALTGYTLHYRVSGSGSYTNISLGTATTATISNLQPNTTYQIYVTATNAAGSKDSPVITATTIADMPKNVSIALTNILPFTTTATVSATGDTNAGITNRKYYRTTKPNVNLYDMPIKSFGGARWARIFYHNNRNGSVLFTSLAECKNTQTTDKYSRLGILDSGDTYKINGKYEFLLQYPIDDPGRYNRWKQTNAPQNEFVARSETGGQVTGYEAVHIDWTDNYWGGLERSDTSTTSYSPTWLDGSVGHDSWFYAIGSSSAYSHGIPSCNSTASVVELWIRIPDGAVTTVDMGTATSAKVTGLSEETTYLFFASATNVAGTTYSPAVEITTPADQAKIRIKEGGTWKKGKAWYKRNGEWVKAKKIYIKVNGQWVIGYNYEN